jgi:transposase
MDKKIMGVDVAKGWLDIALAGAGTAVRIANQAEAIAAWLDSVRPDLVAFEPTGGYEHALQRR